MATNYSLEIFESTGNTSDTNLYSEGLILAYNIFLSTTIAFGVPGNLLVLLVFSKLKVSSTTDVFIIFITIFDFISSCANVPVYLTFTNGAWKTFGTTILCKAHMYLSQVVVLTSVLLTGELAIERYLIICRPHGTIISVKKAQSVCLVTCILTALTSIPTIKVYQNESGTCKSGKLSLGECIYFTSVLLMYVVVFIMIVVCYTKICLTIKRSHAVIDTHRKNMEEMSKKRAPVSFIRVKFNQIAPSDHGAIPASSGMSNERNVGSKGFKTVLQLQNSQDKGTMKDSTENNPSDQNSSDRCSKNTNIVKNHTILFKNTNTSKRTSGTKPLILRQKVRTTKIAFLVCFIFIVSWIIPLSCFVMLQVLTINKNLMNFVLFGKMTYLLNTFSNPFLYAWLNNKFRQKLKGFIKLCK